MKKLLLLCLIITSCTFQKTAPLEQLNIELAPPIECNDTLAGATYPKVVRTIPNDMGIGVFARTFTDAFPLVKRELEAGRVLVRVNLMWSDTHSYNPNDLKFIASESKRYSPLCDRFPGKLFLAPLTEHNIKDPTQYLNAAQANAPNCVIVNTPWKGGYTRNPAYINEVHGDHSVPNVNGVRFAWSDDGRNSPDTNFTETKKKWKDALYVCAWSRQNNLRYNGDDDTPRPQRIKEAKFRAPTKEHAESLEYLFTNKGNTSIPHKWIVKSHSDYHGPGDKKGNKLLLIAGVFKAKKPIELRRNNKKVCSLSYYGPFESIRGFHRYYASTWGYKCGSDLDIFFDGKKYGSLNGGFRDGSYR